MKLLNDFPVDSQFAKDLIEFSYGTSLHDINCEYAGYDGDIPKEFFTWLGRREGHGVDCYVHRLDGCIQFHEDSSFISWKDYRKNVILYVLKAGYTSKYPDSMGYPIFYSNGEHTVLKAGTVIQFDASKEHAILSNTKLTIACFWFCK